MSPDTPTSSTNPNELPSNPSPPRPAAEPFSDHDADVIIRSSDDVDFRAHKLILSKASSVFRDTFSIPSPSPESLPSNEQIDGIPTISITESSTIMDKLLRFCYPVPNPSIGNIEELAEISLAAVKYEMVAAIGGCKEVSARLADADPVRMYAMACRLGWGAEARIAAKHTLSRSLEDVLYQKAEELNHISATITQRLWIYHRQCRTTASDVASLAYWLRPERLPHWQNINCQFRKCTCYNQQHIVGGVNVYPPNWWRTYLASVAGAVLSTPYRGVVSRPDILNGIMNVAGACGTCRASAYTDIAAFSNFLGNEIEKETAKVVLEFASS